jgi:hypothetical protein
VRGARTEAIRKIVPLLYIFVRRRTCDLECLTCPITYLLVLDTRPFRQSAFGMLRGKPGLRQPQNRGRVSVMSRKNSSLYPHSTEATEPVLKAGLPISPQAAKVCWDRSQCYEDGVSVSAESIFCGHTRALGSNWPGFLAFPSWCY